MDHVWQFLVEHGAALVALAAALRAAIKARALRDSAAAEAIRKLASVLDDTERRLAVAEGRAKGCDRRTAELEERIEEGERRERALAHEVEDLRRAIRSDGR